MSHSSRLAGLRLMRLFLLGATGRIGSEILGLALDAGHEVTALVRSPQKLTPRERLRILPGNPLDGATLQRALPGHDAVISAFGASSKEALKPSTLMTDGARNLLPAMQSSGVPRLVIISAAVLFPGKGPVFRFFKWFLRHHIRDLTNMEQLVQESTLDWTIARPGRLARAEDASYSAQTGALPAAARGGHAMSFRAVAAFMLSAAEQHLYAREIVGLSR
jgi:putative NADH-flavin reductase